MSFKQQTVCDSCGYAKQGDEGGWFSFEAKSQGTGLQLSTVAFDAVANLYFMKDGKCVKLGHGRLDFCGRACLMKALGEE